MDLRISTFGAVHTAISVVALIAGLAVVGGLLRSDRLGKTTALYLASATLACLTGYGFAGGFDAAKAIGTVTLVVLAVAVLARYVFHVAGIWRGIYAATAVAGAFSLTFFTLAESFKRIAPLHALAPTLAEPPFAIAQAASLVVFTALGIAAVRRFRYIRPPAS